MKKKILFVINSLGLGGAEKSLTSLLTTFDYEHYDVDLLMFRADGMFLELLPKQVNILPELDFMKNSTFRKQLLHSNYLCAHIRAAVGLRKNAKTKELHTAQCYWKYTGGVFNRLKKHYDVAIAWGQGIPTYYVADKVDSNKKIAFINVDYEAAGYRRETDFPYYTKYMYIVLVSKELYQLIKKVFPDLENKMRVIYDINNANLINKMSKLNNPLIDKKNDLKIVTVGRLVFQKGYDIAISAAKILNEKGIEFKWYFVGEGSERQSLENKIEEYSLQNKVFLVGAQKNPYTYIKNADLYVQTSRFEGYCLTLCEARILNKPIISTNFDVVHNQLQDGENGLIVDINPEAIAEAIIRLGTDKNLQRHLVMNLEKEKKGNLEEIDKLYGMIDEG